MIDNAVVSYYTIIRINPLHSICVRNKKTTADQALCGQTLLTLTATAPGPSQTPDLCPVDVRSTQ